MFRGIKNINLRAAVLNAVIMFRIVSPNVLVINCSAVWCSLKLNPEVEKLRGFQSRKGGSRHARRWYKDAPAPLPRQMWDIPSIRLQPVLRSSISVDVQ